MQVIRSHVLPKPSVLLVVSAAGREPWSLPANGHREPPTPKSVTDCDTKLGAMAGRCLGRR